MTDFGRRAGEGDMLKATYDPNEDGVIALAQTEADMKRATYDPNEDGVIALAQTEADITAAGVGFLIGIHAALANVHHSLPDVAGLITAHAGVSAAHHAQGQTEAQVDALIATHADLPNVHHTPPTADPGEGFVFLDPLSYNSIIQGTMVTFATSTIYHVGPIHNTSNTDGDALDWKAFLAEGTYTLVFIGTTQNICGIIDFYIDATEVASFNMFSGSAVYRSINKQTSIVVASSGIKTIKAIIDGKEPTGLGYYFVLESLAFYRTA